MSAPCGTVVPFGPRDAKIAVVIDAPCANDIWASRILSGGHGDSFFQMMQQAGMFKSACYFTSMFKYRIMGDNFERYATTVKKKAEENKLHLVADGLYCNEQMKQVVEALRREILKLNPTVVVVLGPYSMWALTGEFGSIHTWRGSHLQCSFLPETTVIPTFDPYTLARQYDQRQYCIRDLLRANCVAKQPHLYREPRYDFTIEPSYSQVMGYLEESLREADEQEELWISCDIETIARYISCIGLSKNVREALCIPFMDIKGHYWSEEEEFAIQLKLRELLTHPNVRVIGQNFNYDAQHFAKELGYLPNLAFDTMLGYHALFPGLSKDLSMLSSLFCHWHRYWKDENKDYARLPANMAQYWRYNCLSGETPVLDAYCRWKPLREVEIGDDLLTFHEDSRKLVHASVTNKASSFKEAVQVNFTDGTYLRGTADHRMIVQTPVLYRRNAYHEGKWKTLGELQAGDALPHVPYWKRSHEYEDGWMAGLVDGEGTLGHRSQGTYKSISISVSQKEGLVAERFRRGLLRHGFLWQEAEKANVIYFGVRGGLAEQLRFLGLFETDRIQCNMLNIAMEYGFGGSTQLPRKIVKNSHPIGVIEVFDISTTAGTFLTSSGIAHNCKDVVITYEASLGIRELLSHFGKEKQSADLHRFGQAALRSMLRGVRIDTTLRSHVAGQLMTAITEYQTLINKVAGEPLNTRSTPQMHKLFYGEFDLPVQLDRKTRRPTLGDDALTALMKIEPILKPFIELISMHRKLASFLKNYCQMPLSSDGRMRCSYNVAGTETYRFSSSQDAFGTGGNLQNLSTGTEDD